MPKEPFWDYFFEILQAEIFLCQFQLQNLLTVELFKNRLTRILLL